MHGLQFDVGRFYGNVVGNLRHAAPDLDGREGQDTAGRPDRNIALISHRQRVVILGMRDGEILPLRVFTQVAVHIGNDAYPVVARRALEAQRRRGLVTVQDDIAVIVVKVEVQVTDRLLVRRAGYGGHTLGPDRQRDGYGLRTKLRHRIRLVSPTSTKQKQGSGYKQVFFHKSAVLKVRKMLFPDTPYRQRHIA